MGLIAENEFDGRRLKIDISGDGRSNIGELPFISWRGADAQGIVINGLPILIDTYNLDTYFREKVIHGPGAFIEIATDYRDFAQAFLRKLTREIIPITSQNDPTPDVFAHHVHTGPLNAQLGEERWPQRGRGPAQSFFSHRPWSSCCQ